MSQPEEYRLVACPRCNGIGLIVQRYDGQYAEADPKEVPCPMCQGSGRIEYRKVER